MRSRSKQQAGAETLAKIGSVELERRRLAIVLSDETGFRLYLATYDDPRRRDNLIARLAADLAEQKVNVTRLDVSGFGPDSSLAELLRRHLEEQTAGGAQRVAVMVVGIEHLLDHGPRADGFDFLERANIQREALPKAAPFPVVLWLTAGVSAALPKVATDLWHWRAATFEFAGSMERRADVLRQLAELAGEQGRHVQGTERAERAAILEELIAELDAAGPASTRREIRERITLLDELGTTLLDLGRVSDAEVLFEREIELARATMDAPGLAKALTNLGDATIYFGRVTRAVDAYRAAVEICQNLTAQEPGNVGWQRDLSVSLNKIGRVRAVQGDLAGAIEAYERGRAIAEKLVGRDSNNAEWQRDLSVSLERIGDVRVAQGDRAGAIEAYENSRAIREQLAGCNPDDVERQRDLSVSLTRIGDVHVSQGDHAGAIEAYEQARAIAEKLAARDPNNAGWQRDLYVSFSRIGDLRFAQGERAGALDAFEQGRAVAEKLAARDPDNAEWQRDLSVGLNKIGDVRVSQGDRAGALQAYEQGRATAEKLAARDPNNAGWQRDLIVSNVKLAEVAEQQDSRTDAALRHYQSALETAVALQQTGRLAPVDAWMVGDLKARIARLREAGAA